MTRYACFVSCLAACFLFGPSPLHAVNSCSASATTRDVTPGPSEPVGSVGINCALDSPVATGTITVSANVDFADANAELTVEGALADTASRSASDRLTFSSVNLPPGGVTLPANVTLRISKLRVDLTNGSPPSTVTVFASFQSLPVSNNILTVANVSPPCDYELSPVQSSFDADGGSGSFDVSAPPHCDWNASESESWLSIVSGSSGTGNGSVSYRVSANPGRASRSGKIRVGGEDFQVTQAGVPASADLVINVIAPPSAEIGQPLEGVRAVITNLDEGPAGAFRVGFYFSADPVFGAGDRFSGAACQSTGLEAPDEFVCETTVEVPNALTPGEYYLLAFADDERTVAESDEENNVAAVRVEIVAPRPTVEPVAAVTNGATFQHAAAPGLFVSLFGQDWADDLYVADSLPYPRELGGVSVLLAGEPIPLSMTSPSQINALLPYSLAPGEQLEIKIREGRDESEPLEIEVAPLAPGLFTITQDGVGQAAALTADFRLADSANPVRAGEALQIYCVGLGPVDPPIEAGEAADPAVALYRTVRNVQLLVDDKPAQVLFSGLAPGFSGLYQVNGVIPADVEAGDAVSLQLVVQIEDESFVSNPATVAVAPAAED